MIIIILLINVAAETALKLFLKTKSLEEISDSPLKSTPLTFSQLLIFLDNSG